MVHKPISIFEKAVGIPAANVAMGTDWRKWRTKQLLLRGLVINTTLPLVDRTQPQNKTLQIIHDSSATITSKVTSNTQNSQHISESAFLPSKR